jgi:hypothetical protein
MPAFTLVATEPLDCMLVAGRERKLRIPIETGERTSLFRQFDGQARSRFIDIQHVLHQTAESGREHPLGSADVVPSSIGYREEI